MTILPPGAETRFCTRWSWPGRQGTRRRTGRQQRARNKIVPPRRRPCEPHLAHYWKRHPTLADSARGLAAAADWRSGLVYFHRRSFRSTRPRLAATTERADRNVRADVPPVRPRLSARRMVGVCRFAHGAGSILDHPPDFGGAIA